MNGTGRKPFTFLLYLIVLCLFTGTGSVLVSASSASFRDDFSNLTSTAAAQYYNLKSSQSAIGEWANTGGNALVELQNSYAVGGVTYRVQNAKQITASIFSYAGTQVSLGETGEYELGIQRFDQPFLGAIGQGKFSPSTGRIYTSQGGKNYTAVFDFDHFIFQPIDDIPSDTVPYGLQVLVSTDGASYRSLPLFHQGGQAKQGSSMVYETFGANIPKDIRYLRVEINQLTQVHDISGKESSMLSGRGTRLAGLTLAGAGLILGVKEPILPEKEITTPPVSESTPKTESGGKTTAKDTTQKVAKQPTLKTATAGGSTASKESSSVPKFEGELAIDSPKSGGKSSKKTQGTSSQQSGKATPKIETSGAVGTAEKQDEHGSANDGKQGQLVYQVGGTAKEKDSFSTGVIVYIVLACGFVLFLLLRPKKD